MRLMPAVLFVVAVVFAVVVVAAAAVAAAVAVAAAAAVVFVLHRPYALNPQLRTRCAVLLIGVVFHLLGRILGWRFFPGSQCSG